jgi:hypothetical protein
VTVILNLLGELLVSFVIVKVMVVPSIPAIIQKLCKNITFKKPWNFTTSEESIHSFKESIREDITFVENETYFLFLYSRFVHHIS